MNKILLPSRMFTVCEKSLSDRINEYYKIKKREMITNRINSPIIQKKHVVVAESESEGETPDEEAAPEEDNVVRADKPLQATKYCLIHSHAKSIDTECQVIYVRV